MSLKPDAKKLFAFRLCSVTVARDCEEKESSDKTAGEGGASDISCPVKIVTATRVNLLVKPLDSVGHNGAQPSQCGDTILRMSQCPHCCQTSSGTASHMWAAAGIARCFHLEL